MGSGTTVCKAIVDSAMLTQADVDCSPPPITPGAPPNGESSAPPTKKMLMGNPGFMQQGIKLTEVWNMMCFFAGALI